MSGHMRAFTQASCYLRLQTTLTNITLIILPRPDAFTLHASHVHLVPNSPPFLTLDLTPLSLGVIYRQIVCFKEEGDIALLACMDSWWVLLVHKIEGRVGGRHFCTAASFLSVDQIQCSAPSSLVVALTRNAASLGCRTFSA